MQKDIDLRLKPEQAADIKIVCKHAAQKGAIDPTSITDIQILKRSIDARQKQVIINLRVRLYIGEHRPQTNFTPINYPNVKQAPQAIVVGAGPGGLFAALRLIELGIKPIVVERGKDVRERKKDVAQIVKQQSVNPESNYCFGEGGAGAYSDGKLYTRSKKRGSVEKILNNFCQHGASTDILVDAHPHIGTDKLPAIIEQMRMQIIKAGGEVHFETRMDKLVIENSEVKGIYTHTGKMLNGYVILATGHSARDVYYMLHKQGIKLESKAFAIGVRAEHPAQLIDQIQYHSANGKGDFLPTAEYSFVVQTQGRGTYSFCMCPGGVVVPSASADKQLVVNGMSASHRNSKWSNSGFVVEIRPEDVPEYAHYEELALLKFQERVEEMTWLAGGKKQIAPAQRIADFLNNKQSSSLPPSSYTPGLISSPLHQWMPPFIVTRLQEALQKLDSSMKGYVSNEGVLIAVESRTSSPIRIVRDRDTLQHPQVKGLFPCGEGAGYAGGIMSAAMDGERCAEALVKCLQSN